MCVGRSRYRAVLDDVTNTDGYETKHTPDPLVDRPARDPRYITRYMRPVKTTRDRGASSDVRHETKTVNTPGADDSTQIRSHVQDEGTLTCNDCQQRLSLSSRRTALYKHNDKQPHKAREAKTGIQSRSRTEMRTTRTTRKRDMTCIDRLVRSNQET